MEPRRYRTVIFFRDYYQSFFSELQEGAQRKFVWTIYLIETVLMVPKEYLKHLSGTNGLYEIRVEYQSNIYRVFCFFDDGNLVVAINGFRKKTQKAPKGEIERAQRIRQEYINRKSNEKE